MLHHWSIPQLFGTPRHSASRVTLSAILLTSLVGCSELTSVDALDVVELSDLENRAGAQALRAGAVARFVDAYAGNVLFSQVALTGRISDELVAAIAGDHYDRREIAELYPVASGPGGIRLLSQARIDVLQAIRSMQRFDPGSEGHIAELFALLGYIELFFGENFCSGVPLSSIANGEPTYGIQLTTAQMLERALADLDSAVAYAGNDISKLSVAQVGRGRALLHLGRFAAAAAAVADVPTSFAYTTSHATTAQQNGIWLLVTSARRATVANREGGSGLDFVAAGDPRVRTRLLPVLGVDGHTSVYAPEKYNSAGSPVVLASGVEARLIEAEALLHAGNAPSALAILNLLRAATEDLEALALEDTDAARVDQLFRERAFWLYLTGHRHGDLRRLVRQYGREAEAVFPSGSYRDGLSYGTDVTLELHVLEQNNPNFTGGCFDRDP